MLRVMPMSPIALVKQERAIGKVAGVLHLHGAEAGRVAD